MKLKRIFSGILAVATVFTSVQLPITVSAAAPTAVPVPTIVTEVFGDISNDADGVTRGTDLDLQGYDGYDVGMPVSKGISTSGSVNMEDAAKPVEETTVKAANGDDINVYRYADGKTEYYRRNKILTFVAQSEATDPANKNFVADTETGVSKGAVEIAYMNFEKEPLKIKEGTNFEMVEATWSEAWIDLSTDIQRTDVVLDTFLQRGEELPDMNSESGAMLDTKKITAAQLFATGDYVSFMIYNVVCGEFSGYLRIKVTDNAGNVVIKDYPFVADGRYPGIAEIVTSTQKNPVGSTAPVKTLNTFIPDSAFESTADHMEKQPQKQSKRVPVVDTDALTEALESMRDGVEYKEGETVKYAPNKIWAMGPITVDTLRIADSVITSGIKTVNYRVENNPDNIVLSGGTLVESGELEGYADGNYTIAGSTDKIVISGEGLNILTVTAVDHAGLTKTNRFYFFIDTTVPEARFALEELEDEVASLYSDADVVTNKQLGLDMTASSDVKNPVSDADLIANLDTADSRVYQYRLLNKKPGAPADATKDVPAGYSLTAPAEASLTYGTWLNWDLQTGEDMTAIIDEEFDGLVQVRVQDRAGNWSLVNVSTTESDTTSSDPTNESVITDNTDAKLTYSVFPLSDATSVTPLGTTGSVNEKELVTAWYKEETVLEVTVKDEDLVNAIRSSGLDPTGAPTGKKGKIELKVAFTEDSAENAVKLWGTTDGVNHDTTKDATVSTSTVVSASSLFGTTTDKVAKFYVQYNGTGEAMISLRVTDNAGNVVEYPTDSYNVMLRVDMIAPYATFTAYDATDDDQTELLKAMTDTTGLTARTYYDAPWGPNTQFVCMTVKDDSTTAVQSSIKTIKLKTDKALVLYKPDGSKTNLPVGESTVALSACTTLDNDVYAANPGHSFLLAYEGTGRAHISVYLEDNAGNVRDYPSADSSKYDVMLRVDKVSPVLSDVKLVQTDEDVIDIEGTKSELFSFNNTAVDVTTRKQMKLSFKISDNNGTDEQSGVVKADELTAAQKKSIESFKDDYVSCNKAHLYNEGELVVNVADDGTVTGYKPVIDYILLPVKKTYDAVADDFTAVADDNGKIEKRVTEIVEAYQNDDENPITISWQKGTWDNVGTASIVIPEEFQGAVVVRTIDRVGNLDYFVPITFVAESKAPVIEFDPQQGYIYTQNNYGWSKRDWDYVDIRVKDQNDESVDSWIENVFIKVIDQAGNDITDSEFVEFAPYHVDDSLAPITPDISKHSYARLDTYSYPITTTDGVDVISDRGTKHLESMTELIQGEQKKLYKDPTDGYIHIGYLRVSKTAKIIVTVYDKAKHNDADYSGNKTVGSWISRIDRTAPKVDKFELLPLDGNGYAIDLAATDVDSSVAGEVTSGLAPQTDDASYNKYYKTDVAGWDYLYTTAQQTSGADVVETYDEGTFNDGQFELPGLQYALLPDNAELDRLAPWDFTMDPKNSTLAAGQALVWHNYVGVDTPAVPVDFDGYVIVRAIDRAGNITVCGFAPIVDVTYDREWVRETQFIHVKLKERMSTGLVDGIRYTGNNALVYPFGTWCEVPSALAGEGTFIEVANEGITNVLINASESYDETEHIYEVNVTGIVNEETKKNLLQQGNMNLGVPTGTGSYTDWKYHVCSVKIDKTAPVFNLEISKADDSNKYDISELDNATPYISDNSFKLYITNVKDPTPNEGKEGYSHVASGIAAVEWCAVPQGSDEEKWSAVNYDSENDTYVVSDQTDHTLIDFVGTIKVRVTDIAGNATVKTQKVLINANQGLVNVSKTYANKWSNKPVDVLVTVSKAGVEYSEIKSVSYVVTVPTDEPGVAERIVKQGDLPLTGGTISIDEDGVYHVKVTATTMSGVTETDETDVHIDMKKPTIDSITLDGTLLAGTEVYDREKEDLTATVTADGTGSGVTLEYCFVPYGTTEGDWTVFTGETIDLKALFTDDAYIHTLKLRATDEAGNVAEKTTVVKADKGTPTITVSGYNPDTSTKVEPNINPLTEVKENGQITISSTNETVVLGVFANKGSCLSDIKSLTYELNGIKHELDPNGGSIVLRDERQWSIENITVTMESGVSFAYDYNFALTIDKTAPDLSETKLEDAKKQDGDKDENLFATLESFDRKKKDLTIKVSDPLTNINLLQYAVVEKGTEPQWINVDQTKPEQTIYKVINKAFDGTVLVRATDAAGNTSLWSQNVSTEGIAPEISFAQPYDWQTGEVVYVNVDIVDQGISSGIKEIQYKLTGATNRDGKWLATTGENNWAHLNSHGGQIPVHAEGKTTLTVIVTDYAGNSTTEKCEVKIDRTAPEYSGLVTLLGEYDSYAIDEGEWDNIHDGWTYNHNVSLNGIEDSLSGIRSIHVTFTDGENTATLDNIQTDYIFSESGKYHVVMTDNAGNVRDISFAIDKSLVNVINIIGVTPNGRLHIAVTDGPDMLTFYSKENSDSKFNKLHNGVTDQLWDGATGVRYIYGSNDAGKKSNTLYVLVAPSESYGVSLASLEKDEAPNRYMDIALEEGSGVSVVRNAALFQSSLNENVSVSSRVKLDKDGIYTIQKN